MADAELERTTISIDFGHAEGKFVAVGEVVTFDGFLQVYHESDDEEPENEAEGKLLPRVQVGEVLGWKDITATERFSQRPPRYTEASLGTPSRRIGHRPSFDLRAYHPNHPEPRVCREG